MIDIFTDFIASSRSVGTAATMAACGIYMHRLGLTTNDSTKLLAKISQQVTIPALLFTKIVYCKQDFSHEECTSIFHMLDTAWMILLWPLYVVGCGLLVGHYAAKFSKTPKAHRPLVLASCAFANSTGLPITLLSVIHQNFPPDTELGNIDPTLFLSIYLLIYPVLQWGIGGWLLTSEVENVQITNNNSTKYSTIESTDEEDSTCHSSGSETCINQQTYHEQSNLCERNDSLDEASEAQEFWQKLKNGFEKSLQPPVIASLLGLLVASYNPVRGIFVDMVDRNGNGLLEWIFDGLYSIGQAAVPINMIILGINLSKTLDSRPSHNSDSISLQTTLAVIVGKLIVMPIIGICSVLLLRYFVWDIPEAIDDSFYLVLLIVFITPTANNVMVMVELCEGVSKEGISRLIGWQYAFAPVLLSANVSIIVYLANNNGQYSLE